ncbi:MAG: hypothetical protein LBR80_07320 [Deltaproteobacteria bacterium]|jgi:hypothetical protein|nr:hypothetical protein [Deltaproteobacteria bacterium]
MTEDAIDRREFSRLVMEAIGAAVLSLRLRGDDGRCERDVRTLAVQAMELSLDVLRLSWAQSRCFPDDRDADRCRDGRVRLHVAVSRLVDDTDASRDGKAFTEIVSELVGCLCLVWKFTPFVQPVPVPPVPPIPPGLTLVK